MSTARRRNNNVYDRVTKRIVLTDSKIKKMYEDAEKGERERLNPPNPRRDLFADLLLWLI